MTQKKKQTVFDYKVPLPTEVVQALHEIARYTKAKLPAGWGAVILIPQYGDLGVMGYISTVPRDQARECLQEFLDKTPKA